MDQVKDWFTPSTGYVLQLATPYYDELTTRENLMLAAQIRLPRTFTMRQKCERVEQMITEVKVQNKFQYFCIIVAK